MGKGKKIGIGIGIVFAIFIIIGIVASATNKESSQNVGESSSANSTSSTITTTGANPSTTEVKTKPIEELLPTRDDIGTEWIIKNPVTQSGNGTDYKDKVNQEFTKSGGGISTILAVNIYSYDSSSGAQQRYDSKVTSLKSQGGYKEISGLDSGCYGTIEDFAVSERITVYCVKNNFYISSSGMSVSLDLQDDVTKFAKAVLNRIG
ncbi:MAG: hypothetical protein AUH25_00220 [Thaumarchaeota archaeon 13_1_40CM_38_12]|nr:MAG: hypothetical protein AUH25_00220 [Thaumarchaeota archaeon 13_1_40CM_38_12]OLC35166.1 MAG: hypothetical protein AUH84_03740 [Thaumarchaeota archaeon 13_1_40CM_4_38_7]